MKTHITFKRTGTDYEHNYDVDLNDLSSEEARKLICLIEEADFFNLPESLGSAALLDEQQFIITIKHNDEKRTVQVNDADVPPTLRPLVAELTTLADARPE